MANKYIVALLLLLLVCFVVAEAYDYVEPPPRFSPRQKFCYRECYNQCAFPAPFCNWWCCKGCIFQVAFEDKRDDRDKLTVRIPNEEDYANAPAFVKVKAPAFVKAEATSLAPKSRTKITNKA